MDTAPSRRSWVRQIMGMPISVLARGERSNSPEADRCVHRAFVLLEAVDARFSTYKDSSEVSAINAGSLALASASEEVREVARRCAVAHELTGGLFDARTPQGGWDPSGLVKGWAAQSAFELLRGLEGLDWCLNAGGDVVVDSPSAVPFFVGIQDPRDPAALVDRVALVRGAVATSGTAARGSHLYDPRSGARVSSAWRSVSVYGPLLEVADVLATAAFVAGSAWADVVALVPGYSGLAVAEDGVLSPLAKWPQA